jgi:16S rRNA (cytidine1402-2'-O)-methyltransferase
MLFLVPTPIGNLEDITQRGLRVLREVRAVYCEDTRRTRILFSYFGLKTPLERYDERNESGLERILKRLESGEDLALVSDSGMPVISDPGLKLVSRAHALGLPVCPLPGPCAVPAAVAGSGLPGDSFVFLGFLPRSASKQEQALKAAATLKKTIVLYESPFRILSLLKIAEQVLGNAQAAICRELSKMHEEWFVGAVSEVRALLEGKKQLLGEFTVMLHPRDNRLWRKSSV